MINQVELTVLGTPPYGDATAGFVATEYYKQKYLVCKNDEQQNKDYHSNTCQYNHNEQFSGAPNHGNHEELSLSLLRSKILTSTTGHPNSGDAPGLTRVANGAVEQLSDAVARLPPPYASRLAEGPRHSQMRHQYLCVTCLQSRWLGQRPNCQGHSLHKWTTVDVCQDFSSVRRIIGQRKQPVGLWWSGMTSHWCDSIQTYPNPCPTPIVAPPAAPQHCTCLVAGLVKAHPIRRCESQVGPSKL